MAVTLWSKPTINYPGGFARSYNSADEALAQAVADVRGEVEPQPDRIVEDDGTISFDSAELAAAAQE